MKKLYFLLLALFFLSCGKVYSQADTCVMLGCAANYGTQTTDNSISPLPGIPSSCYGPNSYTQLFWEIFYSPSGGDFAQTFTPTNGTVPLDIDWVMYDIGTSPPVSVSCPVDHSTWTEIACSGAGTFGDPAGPGTSDGVVPTLSNHYYAVGIIINPNGSNPSPDPNFTFTVGTPSLGGTPLDVSSCPGILPVTLTSFNASVNNCVVNLSWTAATEINFKNYEVEYSTDGTNFQTIASISSSSQINGSNQKYAYQHINPKEGKVYYRLKMNDIDGKFEYSKIIALKLDCSRSSILVYPNPVTDILNINITNAQNSLTTASLYNSDGKLIYKKQMVNGTNSINMAMFSKGIYMLQLANDTQIQNLKIIK